MHTGFEPDRTLVPRLRWLPRTGIVLLALLLMLAVQTGTASGNPAGPKLPAASFAVISRLPPPLPGMFECSDEHPCHFAAGTYGLTLGDVLPGLRLKLPRGLSSTENDLGELHLIPPGQPRNGLFIWVDMAAVNSTDRVRPGMSISAGMTMVPACRG